MNVQPVCRVTPAPVVALACGWLVSPLLDTHVACHEIARGPQNHFGEGEGPASRNGALQQATFAAGLSRSLHFEPEAYALERDVSRSLGHDVLAGGHW